MKEQHQKLKNLISDYVNQRLLNSLVGEYVSRGIVNYIREFGANIDYEPVDILIEFFGASIFNNKKFWHFFVMDILSDNHLKKLFPKDKNNQLKNRIKLAKKNSQKNIIAILPLFDLDPTIYCKKETTTKQSDQGPQNLIVPMDYLALHDFQKAIKDEIVNELFKSPQAKMLVHMPTGAGKTKTSLEAIIDFIRARIQLDGFVLWFAHTRELCEQAHHSLKELWSVKGDYPLPVYKIFGTSDYDPSILEKPFGFVFIGFQKFNSMLNSDNELSKRIRWHLGGNTKLVVVDEAHKSLAKTYKAAIDYVSSSPECRLLGLTATPGRSNDVTDVSNKILSDYFGGKLIGVRKLDSKEPLRNPIKYLQANNYLAEIDLKSIEQDLPISITPDEIKAISSGAEISDDKLNEISINANRNKVIVHHIKEGTDKKESIIVFACTKSHCMIIKSLLQTEGINSEIVLGETNIDERDRHIREFKDGKLKVLINYGVLTTGFDAPKLNRLIISRPTASAILYSQMIGRALRGPLNGGNAKNTIIDMKDNFLNLGSTDFIYSYWSDFWGKCPKCKSDDFDGNECLNCEFRYN